MTNDRVFELLKIERKCVVRNCHDECDRNCGACDLAQDAHEIIGMYDFVIQKLMDIY